MAKPPYPSTPFFTKSSNVQNCSYRRKYDLVYMMEKYATSSLDYLQWVNENVNPNKNKNGISENLIGKILFLLELTKIPNP